MPAVDLATALDPNIEILCESCKRPLHEPASRALGRGPVCRKGLRDLTQSSGQLALALDLPDLDTPE
jgi:uncharacterized protein DUF6011